MQESDTKTHTLDESVTRRTSAVRFVDPLIYDAEGAALLGCSKATWWRRVADGTIPRPLKIGGMSRWKRSDVLKVIEKADRRRFQADASD